MNIAILGATSQIARDLILRFSIDEDKHLHLFARNPFDVKNWLKDAGLSGRYLVNEFAEFGSQKFDNIINFVGVGNPAQAAAMGSTIFDVTLKYDELALEYLNKNPDCRYIFLSSGAAYCSSFEVPVTETTKATIDINNLKSQDWYSIAKLHAESRHRSLEHLSIVDIRIFNYFSHTQKMEARYLMTDIVRAINDKTVLIVSPDNIVRDYIGPCDFSQLIDAIICSAAINGVFDCYSKAPIDKQTLLAEMQDRYGLQYEFTKESISPFINATGQKNNYYSLNKRAEKLGYNPQLTSLQNIIKEVDFYFESLN